MISRTVSRFLSVFAGVFLIPLSGGTLLCAQTYTITTLAGQPNTPGAVDGPGAAARFNGPSGVAVDASGSLYVVDSLNHVIRKITSAGVVTTLAGAAGISGSADGSSGVARFNAPSGIAVTGLGTVYVADTFNHTIRVISPGGVVTTLAGLAGNTGSADGVGTTARFTYPYGVAVDASGTVYVADTFNHTIRRIQAGGVVTTVAGTAGARGTANGTGVAARFAYPFAVALDPSGNLYVADSFNHAIRKIDPLANVFTLAGNPGTPGSHDGVGSATLFNQPSGLAVDISGTVYVADTYNHTLRRITSYGVVTTLAGVAGILGAVDGAGSNARINQPFGITVDSAGIVTIADTGNHTIRRLGTVPSPSITTQPSAQMVSPGQNAQFTVVASSNGGGALTYQWQRQLAGTTGFVNLVDAVGVISGSTTATLTVLAASPPMSGDQFQVVVSSGVGTPAISIAVALMIAQAPVIMSVNTTSFVEGQFGTFVVQAVGSPAPTYALTSGSFPVGISFDSATGVISGIPATGASVGSPYLFQMTASNGMNPAATQTFTLIVSPAAVLPAFTTQPVSVTVALGQASAFSVVATGSPLPTIRWQRMPVGTGAFFDLADDATFSGATTATLTITNPTAVMSGDMFRAIATNSSGTTASSSATLFVVVAPPVLVNLSVLQSVTSSGLTAAFTITGTVAKTMIIRGIGPSLATLFGIAATMPDPRLVLTNSANGAVVVSNDDWGGSAQLAQLFSQVGAFALAASSKDSVIAITISPGSYSVALTDASGAGGTALLEIYDADLSARISALTYLALQMSVSPGSTATVGYVLGGSGTAGPRSLLVRALGPSLGSATALTDPRLELFNGQTLIAANDNWSGTAALSSAAARAGALPFGAASSQDSALQIMSSGGAYSARVSGVGGASGLFLLEIMDDTPGAVSTTPMFVSPPQSQAVYVGSTVVMSAAAAGTGPLSYQWRKNGTAMPGATNATLSFSSAQLSDAGSFTLVATNAAGTATSTAAILSVTMPVPVSITSQPVGATLNVTNIGSFRVTATGTAPLAYQWRKEGVVIVGAVSSVLDLGQVTSASAGSYDVVVSNPAGSVTSSPAVLIVNPARVIFTTQPANVVTTIGATAALTVSATGSPSAPALQWRKNGVAVAGATNATLTFASVQATDAGSYDVVGTNSLASATSNVATLIVSDATPSIIVQPVGATLAVGGAVTLSVTAGGIPPLNFQWRRNGLALAGATTASLPIVNAQTYDAGDYVVLVSNALGSATSASARINVVPRVVAYSARLEIGAEGAVAVFTIEGAASKTLLLRAVGPGLASFGIIGLLADPRLEVFNSAGLLLAVNNDWGTAENTAAIASTTAAVGAFALGVGSRDSAVLRSFAPGTYTVRASAVGEAAGVGYLELYDADLATGPLSTIPFVAVRGRVAPGSGVVIGGMGSNGRGQRSYLLRTLGPALGLPGAVSDPSFLVTRDNALVGLNDNWDAVPLEAGEAVAATARLGLAPLAAGNRDAALVLTGNLHAGPHSVQVTSPEGTSGLVLLELHDLDAARPAVFAPVLASPPSPVVADAGLPFTLRALVYGTAPLTYQWIKDEVPVAGATAAAYTVPTAALAHMGSYQLVVTNTQGTAISLPAAVELRSAPLATVRPASQAVTPGSSATFAVTATNPAGGLLTYQWYFTPAGSSTSQALSDASGRLAGTGTANLTVSNAQAADAGGYFCVVANAVAPATSTPAQLMVATRIVRVVEQTASPGAQVVVPIQLLSAGDENTVTFGIQFTPAQLTYVGYAAGADVVGGTVTANVAQKDSGQLGFLVAKAPGTVHAAGTRILITLTFTLATGVGRDEVVPLTFTDQPSARRIFAVDGALLPGAFAAGQVTPEMGLEGDINGDGEVDGGDWVKLGRMVVGLDPSPTSGLAFMRADIAPRTAKGDGTVDGGDWVQLGRYVVGLDALQPAGGPSTPQP